MAVIWMWNALQCAVQGRSHIKTDTPCQDKTYFKKKDNIYTIALADGAGSAIYSHLGAETITQYICGKLTNYFDEIYSEKDGANVKKRIIADILIELNTLSEELKCEVKELASTLLFVAVKDNKFIIVHIGDGVIGYLKNGELKIASEPKNGEFINTTTFTTSNHAVSSMKLIKGEIGNIEGFVLMSDGTETSLYDKRERRFAEVIKKIMGLGIVLPTSKIEELLLESFLNIISHATTDDCSIAMLVKSPKDFNGYVKLSDTQKQNLFFLMSNRRLNKKQINRYNAILNYLMEPKSLYSISRNIHLKEKYTKKHLEFLLSLNFIEKHNGKYFALLILNN